MLSATGGFGSAVKVLNGILLALELPPGAKVLKRDIFGFSTTYIAFKVGICVLRVSIGFRTRPAIVGRDKWQCTDLEMGFKFASVRAGRITESARGQPQFVPRTLSSIHPTSL